LRINKISVLLVFTTLLFSIFLTEKVSAFAKTSGAGNIYDIDIKLYPKEIIAGDAVLVELRLNKNAAKITGRCYEDDVFFFKKDKTKNVYYALVGTDFRRKEGSAKLTFAIHYDGGIEESHDIDIKFKKVKYPEEKLTLPKKMVEPPKETIKQIEKERKFVKEVYSKTRPQRQFDSPFMLPLTAEVSSTFGKKRILNGTPKAPHSGIDLRGDVGKAVKASNSGIVVLARSLYFSGNTIIIDHGLGLYTAYFHLNKILRSEKEKIKKGGLIGEIGMTGRATGPHLHFEVKLNGVPVNPFSIISLTEKIFQKEKPGTKSVSID
jgi:murein DD-endopeptidase MepM/ murein hydrolase activator NlpD